MTPQVAVAATSRAMITDTMRGRRRSRTSTIGSMRMATTTAAAAHDSGWWAATNTRRARMASTATPTPTTAERVEMRTGRCSGSRSSDATLRTVPGGAPEAPRQGVPYGAVADDEDPTPRPNHAEGTEGTGEDATAIVAAPAADVDDEPLVVDIDTRS